LENDIDGAVRVMIEHPEAWQDLKFKELIGKVKLLDLIYDSIKFYLQYFPAKTNELLVSISTKLGMSLFIASCFVSERVIHSSYYRYFRVFYLFPLYIYFIFFFLSFLWFVICLVLSFHFILVLMARACPCGGYSQQTESTANHQEVSGTGAREGHSRGEQRPA
jgi:hypothetical protein